MKTGVFFNVRKNDKRFNRDWQRFTVAFRLQNNNTTIQNELELTSIALGLPHYGYCRF